MKTHTMGVLLVLDRAAPDGVTNQAVELARYLHSQSVSVLFLVGGVDRPLDEMPGVEVRIVPEIFRPILGPFALRRLAADLPVGYRVVHACSVASLPCGQKIAARLGLPLIVTVHRTLYGSQAKRLKKTRAKHVVAVSEAVRSALVNQVGVERNRVRMIHDGISPDRYRPVVPNLDGKKRPVVGTLARLAPEKGVSVFLRAAALVMKEMPGVEFVIAGRGPEEKRLAALAGDLGLREHVTFVLDFVPPASIIPVFDIFVSASLEEGLGLGLIEAAACGKPVVATAVGGAFDAVMDGKTGFIVPANDPEAIASKVLYLLNNPAKAAAMGTEARDFVVEKFHIEKTGQAYMQLYQELGAGAG